MSLTINMPTFIVIITTLSFILILSSITCITLLCHVHNMKMKISDISNMMFFILKKDKILEESTDSIKTHLSIINDNINTLSSNINKNTNKFNTDIKIFPDPQLSSKIKATIKECMVIEIVLSRHLRIPKRESMLNIIKTTINTYPNVDIEYIVKLCFAVVEDFMSDNKTE